MLLNFKSSFEDRSCNLVHSYSAEQIDDNLYLFYKFMILISPTAYKALLKATEEDLTEPIKTTEVTKLQLNTIYTHNHSFYAMKFVSSSHLYVGFDTTVQVQCRNSQCKSTVQTASPQ